MRPTGQTLAIIAALVAATASCALPGGGAPNVAATLDEAVRQTVIAELTLGAALPTTTPLPPTALPPTATFTSLPPIDVTLTRPSDTPQPAILPPSATPQPGATPVPLPADGELIRPNGSPVHASRLPSAPTIDGDLGEWISLPQAIDQIVYRPINWSGLADNSASYAVGWDATHLYLAIRVVDDHVVQTQRDALLYKGDSAELLLDADLRGDYTDVRLSGDDYQLGFSPGDLEAGDPPSQAHMWYPRDRAGPPAGVALAARRTADGYTLEVAIPWTLFGLTPAAGDRYGFALSLSDNDAAGEAEQESMVSSVNTRRLQNPATWGTLILDD